MPTLNTAICSPAMGERPHNGDYGVVELPGARRVDTTRATMLAAEFLTSYTGHTAAAYRRDLADFFTHAAIAHLDPLQARRVDLARYLQHLAQSGLSPATIARRLVAVRGYYSYCVDELALSSSPAARIKTRRQRSQSAIHSLTTNDLSRLLAAADAHSPRLSALTWLLATTGLRISEACGAHIEDLHRVDGLTWLDVTCKGNVRRSVPLAAPAHDRVTTMLSGTASTKRAGTTMTTGPATGPLFATRTGTPLDRHSAARTLRSVAADLNLGPFSPHVLRHTFVTLARANGCALEDVQDAVGHADPATTRRYDRTVASMASHPAGPLLTALANSRVPDSCKPPSPTTANRQSRLIGRGRPMLRLITS